MRAGGGKDFGLVGLVGGWKTGYQRLWESSLTRTKHLYETVAGLVETDERGGVGWGGVEWRQ